MSAQDSVLRPIAVGQAEGVRLTAPSERRMKLGLFATLLCVLGLFSILPTLFSLWSLWTNDPLKSIGGFVPLVSFLLILRAWRALDWELDGSWWGLALLTAIIGLVHLRQMAILELVLSPEWAIVLPPYSLVAVVYVAGAVLLTGGPKLLSRTKFPVLLMWLVNPVPNFFSTHVDLPLQHASSLIARGFAHMLGQQLTSDQLLLMFTPQFGMFIAPGCNGIRGAVTMGMIALVAGYLYQFKPRVTALVVVGAVLLGYVFNFLRLCGLVLYYLVALHLPWLQTRATMGDYVIGATLFAVATLGLFTVIRRLGVTGDLWPPELPREAVAGSEAMAEGEAVAGSEAGSRRGLLLRCGAFAVVIALGSITSVKLVAQQFEHASAPVEGEFPERVGSFHLVRRWSDAMPAGPLVYFWGDYANDRAETVSVGVSPVLGAHDALLCRSARGEDWVWHGDLPIMTQQGRVSFSGTFFIEPEQQYVEAATICSGDSCGQYSSSNQHFGLVYSVPKTESLVDPSPARTIPMIVRATTTEMHRDPADSRQILTDTLREFLGQTSLATFTKPYRKP